MSRNRRGALVDAATEAVRELDRTVVPALIRDLQARDPTLPGLSLEEVLSIGFEVAPELEVVDSASADIIEAFVSKAGSLRDQLGSAPRTVNVDMLELPMSATDYAATRISAIRELSPGGTFVVLARAGQISGPRATRLRSVLAEDLSLDWIVWCGRPPLTLAIVVARERPCVGGEIRLVDGRGLELGEVVGLIESCGRRSGGRGAREAVHRGPLPIDQPWSWWELSPEAAAEREDVRAFGDARPLDELADIIGRAGRRLTITGIEDGELAADHVGIVSGARISPDGELGFPIQQVPRSEINDEDLLREGDCVVSGVARNQLRVALVSPGGPPVIPHATMLVLRFRSSIGATERSAVLAYLRSARFARGFKSVSSTIGDHLRVTPRNLREALVPRFSDAFLEAWKRARDARQQLRAWADEVDDASFFDASSMRAELPAFLERSRLIRDRLTAAAELDTIEGRIRQRYPHPLAIRYENISQMEHGLERIRETVTCAEHLMLFLAFLGVVNLGGGRVGSLAAWTDERGLRLDWGKADSLLQESVAKAARERDRLALPIPELATLHDAFTAEPPSAVKQAFGELRRWRNDESHLARGLAGEVVDTSKQFTEHLRIVFEAAALLTQTPLLAVEDYKRDPHSDEPLARFAYVVGVSAAFRRRWERVESELTREHLVVRDVHGKHHSLHPWLIRRTCSECHHAETFVLNRFDQNHAKYVAMESGHGLIDPALSQVLVNLVRANTR